MDASFMPWVQLVTAAAQLGAGACVLAALLILRPIFSQAIGALADSHKIYEATAGEVARLESTVDKLPDRIAEKMVEAVPCAARAEK